MKAASETIYSLRDRLLVTVERQNHPEMANPRSGRGLMKQSEYSMFSLETQNEKWQGRIPQQVQRHGRGGRATQVEGRGLNDLSVNHR